MGLGHGFIDHFLLVGRWLRGHSGGGYDEGKSEGHTASLWNDTQAD